MSIMDEFEPIPLDYSIEVFGFDIAWFFFQNDIREVGGAFPFIDIDYFAIKALFLNGDRRGYLRRLLDRGYMKKHHIRAYMKKIKGKDGPVSDIVKRVTIFKWVPGDHYHVLGEKFTTREKAEIYAQEQGYSVDGLKLRYSYKTEE